MSIFDFLNLPGDVQVLLYSIGIILVLAYFFAGKDFGIIKVPPFEPRQKSIAGLSGLVLTTLCVLAGLPLFPDATLSDQSEQSHSAPEVRECHPKVFAAGGSLYDFNQIGILSGYNSRVVRGSSQTIKLELRDTVDIANLSCVQLLICKPENANLCSTEKLEYRPVSGHINTFSMPIFDQFEPGLYRIHVKLIQVPEPSQLVPAQDGSFSLSDYILFGEARDFEVVEPG